MSPIGNGNFGPSIGLSGTAAVVGAPFATFNWNADAGVAYIYAQNEAGRWVEDADSRRPTARKTICLVPRLPSRAERLWLVRTGMIPAPVRCTSSRTRRADKLRLRS